MLSSLLVILAAYFNALMDRLENETFFTSVFKNMNQKFWYKRESWKYAKRVFNYKIDGWHLAKSSMIVCLCLAIVFYTPMFGWIDFVLFGLLWNLTFNIFYNRIFKL